MAKDNRITALYERLSRDEINCGFDRKMILF